MLHRLIEAWSEWLATLSTSGGAIAALMFFTILFGAVVVRLLHSPEIDKSLVTTFTNLLMGFAGALLGALSSRSTPKTTNGNGSAPANPVPEAPKP